ncbi:3-methyl-2-oxobutanoate hydroxymethyltransferase [Methylomarinum sp. Ch1-1]|uniref:3-methyl-2-oxobutanoate hydroxymethyltransferase n=1 Tax=Methylomarinum roseum TaxID=3067653 RepID=A0AAU7NY35_9GAMM|nr:3-methyl-2-oxobutanoate hydroxymethyltransferase [Methylomarinum sp. Ch1-1]MDP4522077.1 3-methyl-2-oxobutanoate hydroxymethyltransferase [Methylomarinum sp. Ch1-1]
MSVYSAPAVVKPLSVTDLAAMKRGGEKISCLTAYDASFSALLDRVGIDVILVGDSLGMVIQGQQSTVPVIMDDMVYHSRCVTRVRTRAFVVTDLPFGSYATPEMALLNAARLLQAGGAQMVKLEGARLDVIRFLVDQGVPVCAHLGLLPQSINQLGAYRVQGKEPLVAEQILEHADKVEQAGASMLVLECVPASLAANISAKLSIPVIGIGAGVDCDGQVLVLYDILNLEAGKKPRFYKNFMAEANGVEEAVRLYHQAVKSCQYPAPEHCY